MRTWLTSITAALCALVLLAGVATVSYRLGEESASPLTGVSSTRASSGDLSSLADLYRQLSDDAVDAPSGEVLLQGAIEGMLDTLDDPYASYFDAQAFRRFNMQLDGSFSGVGMMLEDSPDGPVVVSVLPGTPAERAGVPSGHRIVSVDGEDVRGLPLSAIVGMVTGEAGTDVTLGLEDEDGTGVEFELTREEIDLPVVDSELLDGVGHLRLLGFSGGVAERAREAIEDLLEQGAEGIILDLRRNPGGLLNMSVDVASLFLPSGELVVTVAEAGDTERQLRSSGGPFEDLPLVVLVDESSASASEILAGAIQDADRAEIIGVPTFGKGTVQSVRTLPDGSGVKFTTAAYFTPSGDSIEEVGVQPDRVVEDADEQLLAGQEVLRSMLAQLEPAA